MLLSVVLTVLYVTVIVVFVLDCSWCGFDRQQSCSSLKIRKNKEECKKNPEENSVLQSGWKGLKSRAGHLRYFWIYSIIKMIFASFLKN